MEWLYIIPPVVIVALVIIVLWKGWKKAFETILFIAKPATDIVERLVPDNGSLLDRLTRWAKIAVVNLELQYKTAKEATEKGTEERDELNKKIEDQAIALMEEWAEVDQREVPDHVENAARAVVRYEVETFLKKLQEEQSAVLLVTEEEIKEMPTL